MSASRVRHLAIALGVALLSVTSSSAAVIGVTSRAALGPTDTVRWSAVGGDLTPVPNPTPTTSDNGVGVTVDGPAVMALFDGSTFNADFLATDIVLSAFDLDEGEGVLGPIRLTFATGQRGAGAQIQANPAGGFVGAVRAYGTGGTLLGSFAADGLNGQNGDGSALFVGLLSDANDIYAIEFDVARSAGFAINDVSLSRKQDVPEPATLTLALLGAGIAFTRRRQR